MRHTDSQETQDPTTTASLPTSDLRGNDDSNMPATIAGDLQGEVSAAASGINSGNDTAPSTEMTGELPPSIEPTGRREALTIQTKTEKEAQACARWRKFGSQVGTFVALIAIVALFKTFVMQFYAIPSGSMEDTLVVGDRVAVTLYDSTEITHGDIIVFRDPDNWLTVKDPTGLAGSVRSTLIFLHLLPQDEGHHLIKRVIGLPGDHVTASAGGDVSVNGTKLDETYLKPGRAGSEIAFDVTVPEGYVWVMGDNRSNSADSRYHMNDRHGGFVPLSDVVGVAKAVVWPVSKWQMLDSGEAVFSKVPSTGRELARKTGSTDSPTDASTTNATSH